MLFEDGLWRRLQDRERVLIAGAGGGFDVFSGLPLAFALQDQGKEVVLGNLSFANLREAACAQPIEGLHVVEPDVGGSQNYFPERELVKYLREGDDRMPVYSFERQGVPQLRAVYEEVCRRHDIDAIVLVDGGSDILMRGDEFDLATPTEDMASLAAVWSLELEEVDRLVLCLGFGVDRYHGICHAHYLEAVAALTQTGGFLGAFSLLASMPAVQRYLEAVGYVQERTSYRPSIVSASIASAIEGQYGDYHTTERTLGSELYINPLMAMYWGFDLVQVAERNLYLEMLVGLEHWNQIVALIRGFRKSITPREWQDIPL